MLSIKVFDHRQSVIIRILCHGLLLNTVTETVLLLNLAGRGCLHETIRIRFHHFLTWSRLARHSLSAAPRVILSLIRLATSSVNWGPHTVLLHSSEHIPWIVKIVGSEGKSIQVRLVRHWATALSDIRIRCWVARIRLLLLLILQIALHKLTNGIRVASTIILVRSLLIRVINAEHRRRLWLWMALPDAFAILHRCIILMASAALKTHLLKIEVIAALTSWAFRKFVPTLAHLIASLIGLVHGETLLTVLLIRRVFEVIASQRQNHLICLSCALGHTSWT